MPTSNALTMPLSDALCDPELRKFIAACLVQSYLLNPRNTEDVTHPLWNEVFSDLCKGQNTLLPTPQFMIFKSKADDISPLADDPNSSRVTIPDREARGVVVDFCVLFAEIKWNPSGELPERVTPFSDYYHSASLISLYAPVIAELKRAASRSKSNLLSYLVDLANKFDKAQKQTKQQAHCLFTSPRFANQTWAILIAGCGEWWMYRTVNRKRQFSGFFYISNYDVDEFEDSDDDTDDEDTLILKDILGNKSRLGGGNRHPSSGTPLDHNRLFLPTQVEEMKKHLQNRRLGPGIFTKEESEAQKEARRIRAEKRAQEKDDAAKAEARFWELNAGLEKDGCKLTTEDIDAGLTLLESGAKAKLLTDPRLTHIARVMRPIPTDVPKSLPISPEWSGIMRLGTDTSNRFLRLIREKLTSWLDDDDNQNNPNSEQLKD